MFLAGQGEIGFDEETKIVARYHVPGSSKGWLVAETNKAEGLYHHASHWGEHVHWEVHPILEDGPAADVLVKVHGATPGTTAGAK